MKIQNTRRVGVAGVIGRYQRPESRHFTDDYLAVLGGNQAFQDGDGSPSDMSFLSSCQVFTNSLNDQWLYHSLSFVLYGAAQID